jgi:hypothetical protein
MSFSRMIQKDNSYPLAPRLGIERDDIVMHIQTERLEVGNPLMLQGQAVYEGAFEILHGPINLHMDAGLDLIFGL